MATIKITDLTAYADPASTDVLPAVDLVSDITKKVTVAALLKNAGDGTAAAPSITFDSDQDTGLYKANTNSIGIATAGTSRLVIDHNGNVTVEGATTFNSSVVVEGNLTVNGTTTTVSSETLLVEDKNIEMGVVGTPTDTTANGGGITLKGATDKTINWLDATDAWTSSEHIDLASGKEFYIDGNGVLNATTLGSGVVNSSLTSVGTISSGTWQGTAIDDTYLATISTAGKVSNSATTATSANTASAIVARDGSGNFSAGTITAALTGNADTATALSSNRTFAVTGDVTGTVSSDLTAGASIATSIAAGVIVNDDINAAAAIVDTKLDTISTAGKVSNSATTATSANTASAIVARDASGDFSAGTITADLTGNADTATALSSTRTFEVTGDITGTVSSDLTSGASIATSIASGVIVDADVNASAAIAGTKIDPDFGSQTVETTGVFSAAGGAEATPSIAFTGDLNTGIYSPGADQVAISTSGTGRLFVDASGNVGVGESAPSTFDVRSASLTITNSTSDGIGVKGRKSSLDRWYVGYNSSDHLELSQIRNNQLVFKTNNVEVARLTNDGKLGLGTSSADGMLHVKGANTHGSVIIEAGGTSGTTNQIFLQGHNNAGTAIGEIAFDETAVNQGGLSFKTNGGSLTTKMTLTSGGSLGVGTTSPSSPINTGRLMVQGGDIVVRDDNVGSNWNRGTLVFDIRNSNGDSKSAYIQSNKVGDVSSTLQFFTTATHSLSERMRIDDAGRLLVGTSTYGFSSAGVALLPGGQLQATKASDKLIEVNRLTTDGALIGFYQDTTEEGSVSVSGGTVNYNQFLGSHWAALTDWSRPEIKVGTILETINELTDWKLAVIEVDGEQKKICYNGTATSGDTVSVEYKGETYEGIVELETNPEFNKAVKVKINDTIASKAVYGVFVGWNTDKSLDCGIWNDMYVGAVGNYVIRMAAGQQPEIGDLVEADGTGCAVVQDDDIVRTKTVAKITSTIPQVKYDDGSFLVTCVLYCG